MTRREPSAGSAIRLTAASGLVLFLVMVVVAAGFQQLRDDNAQLTSRLASQRTKYEGQIADLSAQIQDLKERWLGSPALWQPPALPPNTEVRFFEVQGTTQPQLLNAILGANLCAHYTCLVDPGVASAGALALEGDEATAQSQYCYSPQTITWTYRHFLLLPHWAAPTDGSTKIKVVEAWDALLAVLFIHEAKHAVIAEDDIAKLNATAHQLASCAAVNDFWQDAHVFDQLNADQNAYHAQLRADCQPELGCVPPGWMGW